MIDFKQIGLTPAGPEHYEFAYRVKKAAQGPYITAVWGWDEALQREFFETAWRELPPMIVTYAGEPLGTLAVLREEAYIEVRQFFILPTWQRHGIGTFLLGRLLTEAAATGRPVRITHLTNSPVGSLYRRLGFEEESRSETHCHLAWQPISAEAGPT